MQKLLAIQNCYLPTDGRTVTAGCKVACPRLEITKKADSNLEVASDIISRFPEIEISDSKDDESRHEDHHDARDRIRGQEEVAHDFVVHPIKWVF